MKLAINGKEFEFCPQHGYPLPCDKCGLGEYELGEQTAIEEKETSGGMTFNEACQTIANELVELICKKQHDYGKGNIHAFGELGLLVRTNDKIERLKNLIGKEGITEPRLDAWRDIVGYGIIALMDDRGWFDLELEDK